jgi:glycosyltransferase involved in cell wall biosynthesis
MFVIPGEGRGCSMIFARRQAGAVAAQGADVHAFYLRSRTSAVALFGEFLRFRKEPGTVRPHIVHAQYGTVTALFAALGALRVPLVITYRGSDLNPAPGRAGERLRGWLARGFSHMAALRARQIVCVSAQLRGRLLWRPSRAEVFPSGADPQMFYPRPRASARRDLGWTEDRPVVLFNAGYHPRVKRLDLAEAAVAAARRRLPALRLEVLDGHCPPEKVPLFMNAADCLLVTSDAEGSPTVVQEALACNLPIVSVDVGDVAERLRGVRATRLVARDPEALAQALLELVVRPSRSDGRRKLHEFSAHRVAAALCGIYRRLAVPGPDANGGFVPRASPSRRRRVWRRGAEPLT